MKEVCGFFDSDMFPLALGAVVLIFHVLSLDIAGIAVCAAAGIFICLFSADLRPFIAVIFLVQFSLSVKYDNNDVMTYFLRPGVLAPLCVLVTILVGALVARLIVTRKSLHRLKFSGLTSGFVVWGIALLAGGLFSSHWTVNSLLLSISLIVTELGFYVLFSMAVDARPDNIRYVCRTAAVAAGVIVLEMANLYAVKYTPGTPLDANWKNYLAFGWAFSNLIGEVLVFLMPAVFYLAHTERRGWAYYLLAIAVIVATYFTLGRNALLIGVPTFAVGTVVCIVSGKNRKSIACLAALFLACLAGLAAYLFLRPEGRSFFEFFSKTRLDDRGRYDLWTDKLELFLHAPVFGAGFVGSGAHLLAHNTLVQVLSSCGVVGFAAYVFHRVQTVSVFIHRPNLGRTALGICTLTLVLMGLLDPVTFYANCAFYYTIFLVIAEKDYTTPNL